MKEKRVAIVLTISAIVLTIVGSTFAYFTWATNASQNTTVTFTVASNYSCSANGGGNITSNDKMLAPATCTDTSYAIQRTVVTNITNTGGAPVRMNMNLKINSIGANLAASSNFKYAITTSSSNCTTGVIKSGTFEGTTTNDTVPLLEDATSSRTYYLWIWLDEAETNNNTQNQSFDFSLDGECTNEPSSYIYTGNVEPEWVTIGFAPEEISLENIYSTPEEAMYALKTIGGGNIDYPFFLRHKIDDGTLWCLEHSIDYEPEIFVEDSFDMCIFSTQAACNEYAINNTDEEHGYRCYQNDFTDSISESYIGFVVTPTMAVNNPGMNVGTYYLRGGDNGDSYEDNVEVLYSAFGRNNGYCEDNNYYFFCEVPGLFSYITNYGWVDIEKRNNVGQGTGEIPGCYIEESGNSICVSIG